jgi:hypothetical protein
MKGLIPLAGLLLVVASAQARPILDSQPAATPAMRALVASIGGDPAQASSPRYAYLRKLDGGLQRLAAGLKPRSVHGLALSAPAVGRSGRTLVDVYVRGNVRAAARKLRALGMRVQAVSTRKPERMVEGLLPVSRATKVAALGSVRGVLSGVAGGTDTGSVLSQGDAAHHGPQARALGPTGAGVTVGVMSDSMNQVSPGVAGSQATGDLPANVTVLNDAAGGEDEGRAMAEIVYDEAPGVTNMLFDTGTTGAATKAAHIAELVSHGAKVIADDTFYLSEPFFQDGTVSQAVDAAKAAGTAYVASAGNRARQSWEGTFTLGAGSLNDFGGGDTRQAVLDLPGGGGSATIGLQWDEPWGSASTNFDINVYGNNTFAFSCSSSTSFPVESCGIANNGGSTIEIEIEIHRVSGTGAPKLKYIVADNFGTFAIKEHPTSSDAIDPDAASANGALTAAAVCWSTNSGNCIGSMGLQEPEAFSSRGPVVRTRDASGNPLATPQVRQKPNVAGADGVSTDLAPGGGLNPFFGTSAAAPSVAGIAALALSANPSLTVDQLYAILTNPANSLDCTSASGQPDTDCGAGFLQADRVVAAALPPPPHTLTVGKAGTGSGTVTSSPAGILCGSACSHAFTFGTPVTLTAAPASGSTFAGWTGDCSGSACSLTMSADHSVTATFKAKPKKCVVPKLKGKTLAAAKTALKKAHCRLGKVRKAYSKKVKRGRVISQAPAPHKVKPANTKVSVVLSRGRKH